MFKWLLINLFLLFLLFIPQGVRAQSAQITQHKDVEASVRRIIEEKKNYQKLELEITTGTDKGKRVIVENGNIAAGNPIIYQVGDKVMIVESQAPGGKSTIYISNYIRREPLFLLFAVFVVLTIIIGRFRGLTSLLGMFISFLTIFVFILPNILAGNDPIQVVMIASFFIVPVTFYISHGLNKKTTAAIVGTLIAILITAVLAAVFIQVTKLTGGASEEAVYLRQLIPGQINLRGLLFVGMIVATLGIVNDITISQAAIVAQLKKTSPGLSFKELYSKTMTIGHDHIASMVNTLILVYTGTALPLLLLFVNNPHPFTEIVNYEIVAQEIVATLVTSIGLILAVPLSTAIASFFYSGDKT